MKGILTLTAAIVLSSVCGAAAQTYAVTRIDHANDLGVLYPVQINNTGEVVLGGAERALVFDGHVLIDIGTLGGTSTTPYGINDRGEVVGESETANGPAQGFIWDRVAGMRPHAPDPVNASSLLGNNNTGLMVGSVHHGATPHQVPADGFLYASGGALDLGKEAGYDSTYPAVVNDVGQVAGQVSSVVCCSGRRRGFLWDGARGLQTLGTFGGPSSDVEDMNVLGQAVGSADGPASFCFRGQCLYPPYGYLYTQGAMQRLDNFGSNTPSRAAAINNLGEIVGTAVDSQNNGSAFLWDPADGARDVQTLFATDSGWSQVQALDINDNGQIAGIGVYFDGQEYLVRPFILTPSSLPAPAVDYLPLSVGKTWTLRSPAVDAPAVLETLERSRGLHRLRFTHPWGSQELTLANQFGKVYITAIGPAGGEVPIGGEALYFDLLAAEGTEWTNVLGTMRVASRNKTVVTPQGTYQDCIQIWATDWEGQVTVWTFAPGVGLVQFGEDAWAFVLESVQP